VPLRRHEAIVSGQSTEWYRCTCDMQLRHTQNWALAIKANWTDILHIPFIDTSIKALVLRAS